MLIGKKYKIESDELNVTVFRRSVAIRGKNAGGETWTAEGYFRNLHNALSYLVEREVKETELKDLKQVIATIDSIKEEIMEATKDKQSQKGIMSPAVADRIDQRDNGKKIFFDDGKETEEIKGEGY